VKALSLTQPWAWVILNLGKRIENRTAWKGCAFRGPILLHAAKGMGTHAEIDLTVECILERTSGREAERLLNEAVQPRPSSTRFFGWAPRPTLPRMGIVGRARIDGVIRNEADFAAYASNVSNAEEQRRWWFGGFALVLADVEPVPFVPWKGALGLFDVPDDYAVSSATESP
jgi:hypothetical protein